MRLQTSQYLLIFRQFSQKRSPLSPLLYKVWFQVALVEFDGRVHRSVCSVDAFMWIQKAESLVYFSIGIRAPIQITNKRIQNDVETFDFEPLLSR